MIYLDENGITVKAQRGAKVGQEYELNGQLYLVVDRDMLEHMVDTGKDVSKVVTTKVKMMLDLFYNNSKFNKDISSWDVSNVNSMSRMFMGAKSFNQDISNWDVSSVQQMESMFEGSLLFNSDISKWDVKYVSSMRRMFANTLKFNQPIGKWKKSNHAEISYMFFNAESFNQDLSNWDVSGSSPISLFEGAKSFNQDLKSWKFKKHYYGRSFNRMFKNAISFNGDISSWDVKHVTHMDEMFMGAKSFNQDISRWDVSNVTKMDRMFSSAESFNQNLTNWNVHFKLKLKIPSGIFHKANNFNLDYNPFQQKVKKSENKIENKVLSSEDKKIISKFKKLFQSEDLKVVNLGIDLMKSIDRSIILEVILKDCEIDGEGDLILNSFFKAIKFDDDLRNYIFLTVLAHSPQNAEIHDSLKLKNIKILNLNNKVVSNKYFPAKDNWAIFISPLHYFNNLKKLTLHPYYHHHGDLKNIIKCTSINELIIPEVNSTGLNNLEFLENLKELTRLEINNIKENRINCFDGLVNSNKLNELCIEFIGRTFYLKNDEFNHLKNIEKLKLINIVFDDFTLFNNLKSTLKELVVTKAFNNFNGLNDLTNLETIEINSDNLPPTINITHLDYFSKLVNLKSLSISDNKLSDLTQLKNIKSLEKFKINSKEILDLDFLNGCNGLKVFEINHCHNLACFDGLKHTISLEKFIVKGRVSYERKNLNLSVLQELKELEFNNFNLYSDSKVFKIMPKLEFLKIVSVDKVNIKIFKYFPNLKVLDLYHEYDSWDIQDLKVFSCCSELIELRIFSKYVRLLSLSGLADMKKLKKLTLEGIYNLNSISNDQHKKNIDEIKSSSLNILELNKCYSIMKTYIATDLNLEKFIFNGKSI